MPPHPTGDTQGRLHRQAPIAASRSPTDPRGRYAPSPLRHLGDRDRTFGAFATRWLRSRRRRWRQGMVLLAVASDSLDTLRYYRFRHPAHRSGVYG